MSDADVIRADFSRLSHTSDAWEAQLLSSPPRPASGAPAARYAAVARERCPVCARPVRWREDPCRGPVARYCSGECQRRAAWAAWERARPRRTVAGRRRVYLERRGQVALW
jgi:hypothetical protein